MLGRGDGVEGRARLVHEEHVGLDGDGPRDAQALLLAAGQAERALVEPILHLVPERGGAQAPLHDALEVVLVSDPEDARPVRDVLEDGLGERVRLLKDHAHPLAQLGHVQARVVDVGAADADAALDPDAVDEIVHAVQAAEQRGLAAAGRPDVGGDAMLGHGHGHVLERELGAVPEGQVLDLDHGRLEDRRGMRLGPERPSHLDASDH